MEAHSLLITFLAQLGVISLTLTLCSLARDRVHGQLTPMRRVASGALFGFTAVLLMNMPGELIGGFRFDLRIVPIAVVGLISGPIGAAVAASLASAGRIWLGGAGVLLGLAGIWLAFAVAVIGHWCAKRGFNRLPDVVTFSALNAGVAFLILFLLPPNIRDQLTQQNAHLILLSLNFLGTLISTFFVHIDRTRREHAQLNELHRQIVSSLPDALSVKDLQGRFLIANEATGKLMGATSAAEMVGKTDFDYYSREEASLFWEQEQAFVQDAKPVTLEQQFERNGQTVWLSTIKAPYLEQGKLKGIVSHTSDITARKALQAELISTQVLLETAMSEMADGLAMFDADGRLVMWNRRYLEFFPYIDEHSCHGRTLGDLLTAGVLRGDIELPSGASPLSWVQEEVERSQAALQSDLKLSDGRWVSKSTRVLNDGGWVTLYTDISEKKAVVQQLEQLASKDGLTELANRRIESLLDFLGLQECWKAGKSPAADGRHTVGQRRRDEALQMQIAQKGTHNPAHGFATVGGTVKRMSLDITDNDLRGERCKPVCAGRTHLPKKSKRQKLVAPHCRGGEPSLRREICCEYIDDLLVLCALDRKRGWY